MMHEFEWLSIDGFWGTHRVQQPLPSVSYPTSYAALLRKLIHSCVTQKGLLY